MKKQKKQQQNNSEDHLIKHLINLPKNKGKRNPPRFGFDLDKLAHGGIIFAPVRKYLRNGKKTFACLQKALRNYALSWNLTFTKTKPDLEIQFQGRSKWLQHYTTLQIKVGCEKGQIILLLGNQQFQKLSGFFCFYFKKFFPWVYFTK